MKIAFIVNSFPSLSETFILNQITGLLDLGHEVDIYAKSKPNQQSVHKDVNSYQLLERTHYVNMPANQVARAAKALALIARNIQNAPAVVLKFLSIYTPGKDIVTLRLLYTIFPFLRREKGYDILMCHFGFNGYLGVGLKQLGIPSKVVTMFHGTGIREGLAKGGQIYDSLFEHGDCFLSISDYNYKHLVEFDLDPKKIVYHPCGIDLERFRYHRPSMHPGSKKIIKILTVARLSEEKGLSFSIEAIWRIQAQNPNLHLEYSIIGDGPLREGLKQRIQDLALIDVVHLLGYGDQNQVIRSMQESHIFVLPSLSEALPVVMMEAQAVGLPVVATNVGSVDQAMIQDKSGYLIPPGNIEALVDRIQHLIDHPEKWHEMGRAGREFIEEYYDIRKLNRRLANVYRALLDGELDSLESFLPPTAIKNWS